MRAIIFGLILLTGCAVPSGSGGAWRDGHISDADARPIAIPMRLKEGDRVQVRVENAEHLSNTYIVGGDGLVALPGSIWAPARGLTVGEFAETIRAIASLETPLPNDSTVEAWLDKDGIFYVLGEVVEPGAFAYRPGLTLADAVASAGGATTQAETSWAYLRQEGESGEVRSSLRGDPAVVEPGDVVRLAPTDAAGG